MKSDSPFTIENKDVLLNTIKGYNESYRAGNPEISDKEYDFLVNRLKELDPENEWFSHPEPVNVSAKRKVSLPIQMKSLNKAKDKSEIDKWKKSLGLIDKTEVIIMPKFDGVSLLHDEIKGKAYSRGGIENEGQDCTEHLSLAGIGSCVDVAQFTYGEFMFSYEDWDKYFKGKVSEHTGDPFKSPRNTAAGLLNRDEPSPYLQHTSFYRYGMDDYSLGTYCLYEEVLEELCKSFDQIPLYKKVTFEELNDNDLLVLFNEWNKLYPIDGVVIYINDLDIWDSIGRHQSTGNPLYAIAYKHPDFTESFETTVKDIAWKISKSGALKPVVNIETVDTGDCNMENPTGYNASWVEDMKIAKGAKVLVTRSGGVIPKILKTIDPATQAELESLWDELAECPHCSSPTAWNESYVELCCTNTDCPGRQLAKIIFFFTICETENIGEETFTKMFNAGYTTLKSILNVTFDELVKLDGFGESISNTILENNKRILKGLDMATLMHASDCFEGIGKVKAQKILDEIAKDDEALCSFYQGWFSVSPEVFKEGSKTMQSFYKGIEPFYKFISENQIPILPPAKKEINSNGKYAGMAICFSGVRDSELEEKIISEGGKIASGVSKNTTILLVKDKYGTSSKIAKAKTLGIEVINIEDFKHSI
ncbi:BRCT domain-containing protein [Bacteroides sp. 224]|uniref:BRCT domain-containing protein n=1 Tax=Bacteroides sp. 224 TaxID=2302936 RepID=UPI0013D7EAC0|nr:BRCT domain-containing protein [Bacteroides sp. 224]NDV63964.1 BRCA1 C Terminus (BRCT) domain protein [Bacteroides sp. 224]